MIITPLSNKAMDTSSSIFATRKSSGLAWLLLGLIFAVGLAVRVYRLDAPPLDFHSTRQLHSALIARGMYYAQHPEAPADLRALSLTQWQAEGVIEPQVMERITAWTYSLIGGPDLQVPRVFAIFFWLVAGIFVAWLAFDLIGWGGALAAALFFLIWPYGVVASRAFQPEPLMLAFMAAGLWAAVRWERQPSWRWAIAEGLLSGLAIYIKSVALFFMVPALAVLALSSGSLKTALRNRQVWGMAILAALPYTLYMLDGLYINRFLVDQFSLRFFPSMWTDPAFYLRWISNLGRAIPFEIVILATLSAFLIQRPVYRWMVFSMWVGYGVLGMTLPHHISTHDYYHVPLFLLAALGLGAAAETIFRNLRGSAGWVYTIITAVILVALVIEGYNARTQIKRSDTTAQVKTWEAIGQKLGKGASVVALVPDYGGGLKYWGWINPVNWLTADEIEWRESIGQPYDFESEFKTLAEGRDYFVITELSDLEGQPELKKTLYDHYLIFDQGDSFIIFDLRTPKAGAAEQ